MDVSNHLLYGLCPQIYRLDAGDIAVIEEYLAGRSGGELVEDYTEDAD